MGADDLALPETVHVLVLNFGLWDIRRFPGREDCFVPLAEYADRVREALQLGRSVVCEGGCVAWVTTTPVEDEVHNSLNRSFRRHAADVAEYGRSAASVCE